MRIIYREGNVVSWLLVLIFECATGCRGIIRRVVSWLLVLIFECVDVAKAELGQVVSWLLVLIFECAAARDSASVGCCVLATSADL